MSKRQRRLHGGAHERDIARSTKRRLAALIAALVVLLLALMFGVGQVWWSKWGVEHQTQIIGIVGLVLLAVIASAPLIVEYSRHPRPLSGSGKNPELPGGP